MTATSLSRHVRDAVSVQLRDVTDKTIVVKIDGVDTTLTVRLRGSISHEVYVLCDNPAFDHHELRLAPPYLVFEELNHNAYSPVTVREEPYAKMVHAWAQVSR